VPTVAVVTQSVLGCLFVMVGDPDVLIRFVGFTLAIFAALTVGALFVMRARGNRASYKTIGYPVTPIAFIALSAWIAYAQIDEHPKESIIVGIVLAIGGVLYFVFNRNGAAPTGGGPQELPEARVVGSEPNAE
jgi:APA family basic amino acid/polyamine antiporter